MKKVNCLSLFTSITQSLTPRIAVATLCAGLISFTGYASTLSWSGGGGANANWNNSANWGFAGIPANGDNLIFPAAQPNLLNTNNMNLTLNTIAFAGPGGGYDIRGNAFTLTNSIQATNSVGANTIENNIALTTIDVTMNVLVSGVNLTMSGNLVGSVGVLKTGLGTLNYRAATANTYSGNTVVNDGILTLYSGFASAAFGGPLIVGNGKLGATPVAQLALADDEIPDNVPITVNRGGTLDLNGFSETIGTSLTLTGGGKVKTGGATLFLGNGATVSTFAGIGSFGYASSITGGGVLNVGSAGQCTFAISSALLGGTLTVDSRVDGAAAILKTGAGFMSLTASNSFTGQMNIAGGTLGISNPYALGSTSAGTTVSNTATLQISGVSVTNEPLTIASSGIGLVNASGANTWASSGITLAAATTFEIDGVSLDLQSPISGSGGFTKTGIGTLRLSGSDTYTGDTTVNSGVLELNSVWSIHFGTLFIGDGNGGPNADVVRYLRDQTIYGGPGGNTIVINNTGLLDLNGFTDDVGPIAIDGGGNITTGTGTLTLFSPLSTYDSTGTNGTPTISGNFNMFQASTLAISNDLFMNASVSGFSSSTLTKTGPRLLYLNSSNSYSGLTVIQQGWIYINNAYALGATNNGTVVSNGATLAMSGNFGVTNESLTLNGPGEPNWGALDSETGGGTNLWVGPITLSADSNFAPYSNGSGLRIIGLINGPGGFTEFTPNNGTLYLEGSTANSYAGNTTVSSGTLVLNKSISNGTIPHNLDIFGTVRLGSSAQIADSSEVKIESGGLFDCGIFHDLIDTLRGPGNMTFGVNGWIEVGGNNGSSTYDGVMSGTGYTLGGYTVAKRGSGTFIMNGNNTFTAGATHVFTGKLVINGSQPQVPAIVDSGSALGGSGTVGTIAAGGIIAPGNSPGILTSSNVTFSASGKFNVEITGPNPGTDYDQLNVRGTNSLANATLGINLAFTTPVAIGHKFTIINNDDVDPITGIFLGYPEGSTFAQNGFAASISYVGGTGNDVVFTLTSVPGAAVSSAVTSGDGNHGIDPNECNNLSLVISNTAGTPMTGNTATLSTTTPGVLITQPYSAYPNIPANGKGTNTTPFQISTLPSFVCGNTINLQLSVDSSLGSFTTAFVQHTGTPAAPVRFDNNTVTNCPDFGTIESTNNVPSWVGGPITKVAVSLWLLAPADSDMNLTLIAPDGTSVDLSSGNGAGANFGSGNADGSRTTFDDAAGTSIMAGTPPFVGSFQPEAALASLIGTSPVGPWRLRLQDNALIGSVDTLRAWSLFLYGTSCGTGGGACDYCLTSITGSITNTDLVQTNRISRNGTVASCGAPKSWPGFGDTAAHHYDIYAFTNTTSSDACVTVLLTASCDVQAGVYLNAFDPANITNNYAGDSGNSTGGGTPQSCSASIPPGAQFFVTVNEINPGSGCSSYTLQLSGLPCPPPILAIDPLIPAPAVRVHWPTWAGGYILEATPSLSPTNWTFVTNEPIVTGLQFNVTNTPPPTNRFYRLQKP